MQGNKGNDEWEAWEGKENGYGWEASGRVAN
jgi:hypothetical protein